MNHTTSKEDAERYGIRLVRTEAEATHDNLVDKLNRKSELLNKALHILQLAISNRIIFAEAYGQLFEKNSKDITAHDEDIAEKFSSWLAVEKAQNEIVLALGEEVKSLNVQLVDAKIEAIKALTILDAEKETAAPAEKTVDDDILDIIRGLTNWQSVVD